MASVELQARINEWLNWDKVKIRLFFIEILSTGRLRKLSLKINFKNEVTRSEIKDLVAANNHAELKTRLLQRMEFGTAGLRARMGAGYSMMNDLTIIQTGQGFCDYLMDFFGQELYKYGVIIGYDARHNSTRFAHLTANIFLRSNIPVYLFRQISPTPFVVCRLF
jgi:phosphoglucomutase/phosphopentomutase